MISCEEHKILTFPLSLVLDITDIGQGEEWGDPREEDVVDEPPVGCGGSDSQRAATGEKQGKQWPHHGW